MTAKRTAALVIEFFPCLVETGAVLHLGCSKDRHHVGCPALFRYRAERLVEKIRGTKPKRR